MTGRWLGPERDRATRRRLDPEAVRWSEVDGEVIAVDPRVNRFFGANATATLLWPLLVDGATSAELADAIVRRWAIDPVRARHDADAFIAALDDAGLLVGG